MVVAMIQARQVNMPVEARQAFRLFRMQRLNTVEIAEVMDLASEAEAVDLVRQAREWPGYKPEWAR